MSREDLLNNIFEFHSISVLHIWINSFVTKTLLTHRYIVLLTSLISSSMLYSNQAC